ncbi:hypothetical protein Sste5346_003854 [Sporothrix stenoceras]|uniref:2EXR domain-containing protein n=1 Tax=Sporothrix stenoceras TaxID=5173 RepID=A0ABR3ZBE5_9PEZI
MSDSEESGSDGRNEMDDGRGHAFVDDEAEESGEDAGTEGDDESGSGFVTEEDDDDEPDLESERRNIFNLMGPRIRGEIPSDLDDEDDSEDDSEEDEDDEEEDDEDSAGIDDERRWEQTTQRLMDLASYADFGEDDYPDSSDIGTDYDFGAYDSDDSWDNTVEEDPHGNITTHLNIKKMTKRLKFFTGREKYPGTRSFPKFTQLPAELRLRIWELYCSELQRKQRVIQVYMQRHGRLTPAVTMDQQTKAVRRLMSICHETREMGTKALPDVLPVGHSKHDKAVIRFNAETDLVHFLDEHPFGLNAVGSSDTDENPWNTSGPMARERDVALNKQKKNHDVPEPYTNVRNLVIGDMLQRSREPGAYHDHHFGHSHIELVSSEDASHRRPEELRGKIYEDSIKYLFPNVQNIYVSEDGAFRRSDKWAGHLRSYQRYHVRAYEVNEYGDGKQGVEYLYLWHAPPKEPRRRSHNAITNGAEDEASSSKEDEQKEKEDKSEAEATGEASAAGESADNNAANGENDENDENNEDADNNDDDHNQPKYPEIPGDFKDGVVINHFSSMREKGVRFSRLLFFENEGLDDYWDLQKGCRPDGSWPNNVYGDPEQDQMPARYEEDEGHGGAWGEFDDEEDDSMIDDDPIDSSDEEDNSGDSDEWEEIDEEDDLDGDDDDAPPPLAAMFSSPEPEPEEVEGAAETQVSRGKKRRVVSDSDDEDSDDEDAGPAAKKSKTSAGLSKRQRRTVNVSSDEAEDDDDKKDNKKDKGDESSSHTEAGSDSDDDDEDEDDKPAKPLTLMQKLAQGRKSNPISIDDDVEEDEDDEEADEDAGDYGEGDEDEDDEDDE